MKASVRCPACKGSSSLEGHAPGTSFVCACGNKLPVPTGMRAKPFGWIWLPFILGGIALQVAIVQLVTHSFATLPEVASIDVDAWRPQTAAIRAQLHDLCDREGAQHAKSHDWVVFPPTPESLPTTPAKARDPRFAALGFEPKESVWQFFVLESADHIECIARANLDSTGVPYTIAVGNNGTSSYDVSGADEPPEPQYD